MKNHNTESKEKIMFWKKKPKEYESLSSIAKVIRDSLQHETHYWKSDGYYLTRQDGLKIWIASGAEFCRIEHPWLYNFTKQEIKAIWPFVENLNYNALEAFLRIENKESD